MKKVIIRTKASAHPMSNYINKHYEDLAIKNVDFLLSVVYEESETYECLIENYNSCLEDNQNNDFFLHAYLLSNESAVVIDSHITLYKLCSSTKESDEEKVPWKYYRCSKYLGDTWWFSDSEIINDLLSLPIVEFLVKYRGI